MRTNTLLASKSSLVILTCEDSSAAREGIIDFLMEYCLALATASLLPIPGLGILVVTLACTTPCTVSGAALVRRSRGLCPPGALLVVLATGTVTTLLGTGLDIL